MIKVNELYLRRRTASAETRSKPSYALRASASEGGRQWMKLELFMLKSKFLLQSSVYEQAHSIYLNWTALFG